MITMAEALNRAARQFREYQGLHEAKLRPDLTDIERAGIQAKANRNREMADMCEEVAQARPFQARAFQWALECFGERGATDLTERCDRQLEETLELLQAMGYDFSRIPQLVSYVAGRPVGEKTQEVGGVLLCLGVLCSAAAISMGAAAESELSRVSQPETMERIRAKQAAKPWMSPLPQ